MQRTSLIILFFFDCLVKQVINIIGVIVEAFNMLKSTEYDDMYLSKEFIF